MQKSRRATTAGVSVTGACDAVTVTDLDRRVEELAAKQHGVFSTRQVLLLNGTHDLIAHRVKTRRWSRDAHGVLRLLGAPPTDFSKLLALLLASKHRAVVSHRCAAALYGRPGYSTAKPEITVPGTGRMEHRNGVVIHRSNCVPTRHRTTIEGIAVSTLPRVLLELTAVVPIGRAARTMDTALGDGSVKYPQLVGILVDVKARGRRRTQVFRMLLAERGPLYVPPASELERRFDRILSATRFAGWRRQVNLGNNEEWIGRVDFVHADARLVVEVDGKAAHSSFLDRQADRARDRALTDAGFRVLRFGWGEVVGRPKTVLDTVRGALNEQLHRDF